MQHQHSQVRSSCRHTCFAVAAHATTCDASCTQHTPDHYIHHAHKKHEWMRFSFLEKRFATVLIFFVCMFECAFNCFVRLHVCVSVCVRTGKASVYVFMRMNIVCVSHTHVCVCARANKSSVCVCVCVCVHVCMCSCVCVRAFCNRQYVYIVNQCWPESAWHF